MQEKYKCDLSLSAEDNATGYMYLTREEYEIVKKVSNIANWENFEGGGWCGIFSIYCEELEIGDF